MKSLEILALIASIVLPFWNIPLLIKIIRQKSSSDLSLAWAWGVWVCIVLMLPWAICTEDIVFKVFNFVNFILFSVVLFVVLKYYKGDPRA